MCGGPGQRDLLGVIQDPLERGCANGPLQKSPHWGLNPEPSVYKTDALPLSYRG